MLTKNIILCLMLIVSLLVLPTKAIAEPVEIVPPPTFEQEMYRIFGDKTEIAYAVIMHESSNNLKAKNYNCFYYNSEGKRYSTFCKPQDKSKAWSVDCGIAQINVRGQVCPDKLLTKEGSLPYIEKIYKEQGLNAWVSFKTGAYKQFLTS